MSTTPRVDALWMRGDTAGQLGIDDLARQLERELAEARKDTRRLLGAMMNIMQTACDADEAPAHDLLRQILDVCVLHVQGVKGNDAAITSDPPAK